MKLTQTMTDGINQALFALTVAQECDPTICIMGLLGVFNEGLMEAAEKEELRQLCLLESGNTFIEDEFFSAGTIDQLYERLCEYISDFEKLCEDAKDDNGKLQFESIHTLIVFTWLQKYYPA